LLHQRRDDILAILLSFAFRRDGEHRRGILRREQAIFERHFTLRLHEAGRTSRTTQRGSGGRPGNRPASPVRRSEHGICEDMLAAPFRNPVPRPESARFCVMLEATM